MLFNKSNNGIEELNLLTGFFYNYNNFDNIRTDILLAEEYIADLVGKEVMAFAQAHYDSVNYQADNFDELTDLVYHIQLPVTFLAIKSYSENADLSHEDTGRKVKIDAENEKLPWQWMLDKDEKALVKKANKTIDRLIAFLDENVSIITPWKDSEARKSIAAQFIVSASQFNDIYPIESSRSFFIRISPFIREAELNYILPVLTKSTYDDIKAALKSDEGYQDTDHLLDFIRVPLALFAMGIAIERLALDVLPDGVYQNVISDNHTMNAKKPANMDLRNQVSQMLKEQAESKLSLLQNKIKQIAAIASGSEYESPDLTQGLNADNQFARI